MLNVQCSMIYSYKWIMKTSPQLNSHAWSMNVNAINISYGLFFFGSAKEMAKFIQRTHRRANTHIHRQTCSQSHLSFVRKVVISEINCGAHALKIVYLSCNFVQFPFRLDSRFKIQAHLNSAAKYKSHESFVNLLHIDILSILFIPFFLYIYSFDFVWCFLLPMPFE